MIKVLIVEDDPMVASINKGYLESITGFRCIGITSNVTDAVSFLEMNSVDLVLMDIFMPQKTGLELLTDIRNKKRGIDVIVISAASDMDHIKACLRLGAVDYLIKPFEFQRFNSALKKYYLEHEFMKSQKMMNQEELDKLLHNKTDKPIDLLPLPKGLTPQTLKLVLSNISVLQMEGFSTEELANKVGISRISMRKYLQFLTEIGYLYIQMDYGSSGRPVYRYHINKEHVNRIHAYIKTVE